jgi:hypothetical protein
VCRDWSSSQVYTYFHTPHILHSIGGSESDSSISGYAGFESPLNTSRVGSTDSEGTSYDEEDTGGSAMDIEVGECNTTTMHTHTCIYVKYLDTHKHTIYTYTHVLRHIHITLYGPIYPYIPNRTHIPLYPPTCTHIPLYASSCTHIPLYTPRSTHIPLYTPSCTHIHLHVPRLIWRQFIYHLSFSSVTYAKLGYHLSFSSVTYAKLGYHLSFSS